MSWITITEAHLLSKLSSPELAAMKSAALGSGQANPLTEAIADVTREVRGYVAGCSTNTLGEGDTIPDELLGAAINRIRYELATRLPVASLLTEARKDSNRDAVALFSKVAACTFRILPPATVAPVQVSAPSPLFSGRTRQFTRATQDGA